MPQGEGVILGENIRSKITWLPCSLQKVQPVGWEGGDGCAQCG